MRTGRLAMRDARRLAAGRSSKRVRWKGIKGLGVTRVLAMKSGRWIIYAGERWRPFIDAFRGARRGVETASASRM